MQECGWLVDEINNDGSLSLPNSSTRLFAKADSQGLRSTDDDLGLIDVVVAVGDADDTEGLEQLGGHSPTSCGARVLTCYLGGRRTGDEDEQWGWGKNIERGTNLEELGVE